MLYLTNAFFGGAVPPQGGTVEFRALTTEQVYYLLETRMWVSCIGHADAVRILDQQYRWAQRGIHPVEYCRGMSPPLSPDVEYLAFLYRGPRLPEGATVLPEGATLTPYHVRLVGTERKVIEP